MSQIVALNFCYDVPVKLFSCHLLALAIFLAAPDTRRLANLFVLNRTADPALMETVLQRPAFRRGAFVLKMLLLVGVVGSSVYQSHSRLQRMSEESPLSGIWEVEEFTLDGEVRPPLLTDDFRWRRLIIGRAQQFAFVQRMNDERRGHPLQLDVAGKKLFLRDDRFAYSRPTPETLRLEGKYRGRALRARLRLMEPSEFRLTSRGFHWINERPYNR